MCDKMGISAYILKIVQKYSFLRLQLRAKENFNRHQLFSFLQKAVRKMRQFVGVFFGKDEIFVKL